MSFYFTVFVSKERKITHQKDPFLEFLIFLVGRVHAKLISLESNSAILLRHNQIYSVILLRHSLFMLTFLFLIVTGFKRFRESGRKRHKGKFFFLYIHLLVYLCFLQMWMAISECNYSRV